MKARDQGGDKIFIGSHRLDSLGAGCVNPAYLRCHPCGGMPYLDEFLEFVRSIRGSREVMRWPIHTSIYFPFVRIIGDVTVFCGVFGFGEVDINRGSVLGKGQTLEVRIRQSPTQGQPTRAGRFL